jgi:hypothetical protein
LRDTLIQNLLPQPEGKHHDHRRHPSRGR